MNHLRESCVSSVISWQKAVSDRFWGLAFCFMTLACWCTTSWLRSSAHFHTWLTLSPSLWVASLLKALRPSSMGTLAGLIPAELVLLLLQQSQKHQTEIQFWALAASSSGFMWNTGDYMVCLLHSYFRAEVSGPVLLFGSFFCVLTTSKFIISLTFFNLLANCILLQLSVASCEHQTLLLVPESHAWFFMICLRPSTPPHHEHSSAEAGA